VLVMPNHGPIVLYSRHADWSVLLVCYDKRTGKTWTRADAYPFRIVAKRHNARSHCAKHRKRTWRKRFHALWSRMTEDA
jgi:hypothetical protein